MQRITKRQLEDACKELIADDEVFEALMKCTALPVIVKMAAERAFLNELLGHAVDVVRIGLGQLHSPGWFDFEDECDKKGDES